MKNNFFSIMPVGGVQEIGSNMTLIRTPHEDVVIDCGLLFPYEDFFDINYLIPDFSIIDPQRFKSIIITHGHEDHIGALAHLLKKFPDISVHVSKFTLHLLKKKLEEQKIKFKYVLFDESSEINLHDVDIFPVHVNHSIPETYGLVICTKKREWGALYISDFKVDLGATHEKPINFQRIGQILGYCKKTIYFIDSTNILSADKTNSEVELKDDLRKLISSPNERIFITLFASNIHRIQSIFNLGKETGRQIVLMGRSLKNYLQAGFETNHFNASSEDFLLPEQAKGLKGKMLVLVSGCQGDYLSALRRFSFGEDSIFKPGPDDLVIFSSKVIPGNEKRIYRIYNKLTEFGAEVITSNDYLIHASGHPGKEDLKLLLNNFKPDFYIPIHGESYLLKKHHEFISQHYPDISSRIIFNYHEVILGEGDIKVLSHEIAPPRLIHGNFLEIEKKQISQRRKMATTGAVLISYLKGANKLEITTLGLPEAVQDLSEALKKRLLEEISRNLKSREDQYVKEQLRIITRQFYGNFLGYRPVTEVHLF